MDVRRVDDDLGVAHTWGAGPEVIVLSNPLADPVAWSTVLRAELLTRGYQVTTFEHRPRRHDWRAAVECVDAFVARRSGPLALVGWSQGAAIAQEVALTAPAKVRCAALLATYGRQNELDRILQEAWQQLDARGEEQTVLRLALGLLTAFPPHRLAADGFVSHLKSIQPDWAGVADPERRRRAVTFIPTYQDRLPFLADVRVPCLVVGFELDVDTGVGRAREVAQAVPHAEYVEVAGAAHAAPVSDAERVWPLVIDFVSKHHHP